MQIALKPWAVEKLPQQLYGENPVTSSTTQEIIMKTIICLIVATAFAGLLVGCEPTYYNRHETRSAYPSSSYGYGYGYYPSNTYYSRDSYYRHYNDSDR
jgi:hypothetical protein